MAITYTRNDLINRSFRLMGVIDPGEPLDATEVHDAALVLNLMLKEWRNRYPALWKRGEGVLHFADGVNEYNIGSTGDHATGSWVKTEIATAAASGATSMVLDSTSGMTAADAIGVVLDDGTLDWSVISSVDNSTELTMSAGLGDTAAVDNEVFTYTSKLTKPIGMYNFRVKRADETEVPIMSIDREAFMTLPTKNAEGMVTQVYFDPQEPDAKLYVWPTPDSVSDRLFFTYDTDFTEFSASGSSIDFPDEWWNALTYGLAVELAPEYGLPDNRLSYLTGMLERKLADLQRMDQEDHPIRFEVWR